MKNETHTFAGNTSLFTITPARPSLYKQCRCHGRMLAEGLDIVLTTISNLVTMQGVLQFHDECLPCGHNIDIRNLTCFHNIIISILNITQIIHNIRLSVHSPFIEFSMAMYGDTQKAQAQCLISTL